MVGVTATPTLLGGGVLGGRGRREGGVAALAGGKERPAGTGVGPGPNRLVSPRSRSIPSVTIRTCRRALCSGHALTKLMRDRYGLSLAAALPLGRRRALAARP